MTDKEAKAFYNSSSWKRKREDILDRDCHECQDCRKRLRDAAKEKKRLRGEDAKIRTATEVHHIKELKERYPKALVVGHCDLDPRKPFCPGFKVHGGQSK